MKIPLDDKALASQAKTVVYRLFRFRIRSEFEIRKKLKEKGFTQDIINQTVAFFATCEMVNDTIFTKAWIASRLNKPMGLRRIKQELKEKGIADDIITAELNAAKVNYDESEAVEEMIKKRARTYAGLDPVKARRRMEGYLFRRGFSQGTVYKMLSLLK